MIVATNLTSCQKTARNVPKMISSARIIAVFPSNGNVTSQMIAVMVPMKLKNYAKAHSENALNLNTNVLMVNAFQPNGVAITKTIAAIILTR